MSPRPCDALERYMSVFFSPVFSFGLDTHVIMSCSSNIWGAITLRLSPRRLLKTTVAWQQVQRTTCPFICALCTLGWFWRDLHSMPQVRIEERIPSVRSLAVYINRVRRGLFSSIADNRCFGPSKTGSLPSTEQRAFCCLSL